MSEGIVKNEAAEGASVLEQLLRPELPNVAKELPLKRVKIKRLSQLLKEDVVFTLQGLPYGRVQELSRISEDAECHILLAGCVEPDLKSPALKEKFGGATPIDTMKAFLLPGEIADLSREVEKLCGYRMSTIERVKN
jgi:hypothetical protein